MFDDEYYEMGYIHKSDLISFAENYLTDRIPFVEIQNFLQNYNEDYSLEDFREIPLDEEDYDDDEEY